MIPVWLFPCVAQAVCRLMEVGHVVSVKHTAVLCRKLELGGIVCLQFAGFNRSEDIVAASAQTPDEGTRRGVFVEVKAKLYQTPGETARVSRSRREMSASSEANSASISA